MLPELSTDSAKATKMQIELEKVLEPIYPEIISEPITFQFTANREFEENWWNDIKTLAHGQFVNKDNADCVLDEEIQSTVERKKRDLEPLGNYLMKRHNQFIKNADMKGKALCGEIPFKWETDFEFNGFGGWVNNQNGKTYERNILVIIPGKNRKQAVLLADHYDTAYMEDVYFSAKDGKGARISAAGADDNFSATSTLLQAAPIFLKLSKEGKLKRDVLVNSLNR